MKSIKKLKESTKAVAGSALLVGATLTGAAGLAAAAPGTQDLGDYPEPFVDEDGNVDSTIVVGESAKTVDVVGAINIAGSLGNAAFTEEEVSAGGATGGTWSASNGVSLDTQNDNLFFGSNIDDVRQTLTEDQLEVLETTEVLTGDAEQDVEQYLYLGEEAVDFGTPGDTDGEEDPFLHIDMSEDASTEDLYTLQANFQDGVQFDDGGEKNEDVYGEEIELFGSTFTVADESFTGNSQLILYGSQEEVDVENGEEEVITADGNEHTVETVAVTSSSDAAVRIDGSLEQVEEDDEFDVSGETLRIDSIIDTGDNGAGVVQFAVGSEQVTLEDGEPIMIGSDEDDVEGTEVSLSGGPDLGNDVSDGGEVELSSVEVAVAADDSDNAYIRAGETFEDPFFDDVQVHFGGLNPDAQEDEVGEIEFSADGDDIVTASWDDGDNSVTQGFAYDSDVDDGSAGELAADEDEEIRVVEGAAVSEDDYFTSDAGDFSHMWQVTSIDADETEGDIEDGDEATVELEDQVTGASVELDLDSYDESVDNGADSDFSSDDSYYRGTEVIDGQTYHVAVDDAADDVYVAWGGSSFDDAATSADAAVSNGDETSVYTPVDTDSGAAIAFTDTAQLTNQTISSGGTNGDIEYTEMVELPSTESTDAKTVNVTVEDGGTAGDYNLVVGDNNNDGITVGTSAGTVNFEVGQTDYVATLKEDPDGTGDEIVTIDVDNSQTSDGSALAAPAAVVVQPEDDSDNEEAYVVAPSDDGDTVTVEEDVQYTDGYSSEDLDSDDNVEVSYNAYGTHTERDTEDEGSFTLNIPSGQATAGVAVTGEDGSISAEGGAGSVTTQTPTGFPDAAQLDSDVSASDRSDDMILVGGPAVNTLVEELASENQTQTGDEYSEGSAIVQIVNNAFNEGQDALVVAGYAGEDTREASSFIANYADNAEELAGQETVELTTQQTQNAE